MVLPNPQIIQPSILLSVLWQFSTALLTGQGSAVSPSAATARRTSEWSGVITQSPFPERVHGHGHGQHSLTPEAGRGQVLPRLWAGEAAGFFLCLLFSPWAFSGQAGTDEGREVTFRLPTQHTISSSAGTAGAAIWTFQLGDVRLTHAHFCWWELYGVFLWCSCRKCCSSRQSWKY